MAKHPNAKPKEVADALDLPLKAVYNYRMLIKKKNIQLQAMDDVERFIVKPDVFKDSRKGETVDNVNHPSHYKTGGIETIDFIEAKQLGYHLGNVVKYITRADHKGNKLEDLKKAQWYLSRAIENESK